VSTQAQTTQKQAVMGARLEPMPIPTEWIIEGAPDASAMLLWRSADGKQANGIWECTPGTFNWTHTDETATILAGRVTVTVEGAEPFELNPGDLAFFPEGTTSRWEVHEKVRKAFHLHASEGLPF
jgi:uncharacterized cupin superfamily protein